MTVESIGNIADAYSNGNLPKHGMIISATKEELKNVAGDLLYQDVVVAAGSIENIQRAKHLADKFYDQLCRCKDICDRLDYEPTRQYSREEVLEIIDELLDGIKPKKTRKKKADAKAHHHEESEEGV